MREEGASQGTLLGEVDGDAQCHVLVLLAYQLQRQDTVLQCDSEIVSCHMVSMFGCLFFLEIL